MPEELDLTPEDEAAIDAAWDLVGPQIARTPPSPFLGRKSRPRTPPKPAGGPAPYAALPAPTFVPYNEAGFRQAIDENPFETTHHLAFADWLDEAGQPEEAAFRRALAEWVGRGEDAGGPFSPSNTPSAFRVNKSDGLDRDFFSHSIYRPHLPDWAAPLQHVGESRHGVTREDPAVAFRPNQYWYHWRGYRPMEEGLRRAFLETLRREREGV